MSIKFQIMSQLPRDRAVNFILITFAAEDMGDTPSSPLLVTATPSAEINRLIINSPYRFKSSLRLIFSPIKDLAKRADRKN